MFDFIRHLYKGIIKLFAGYGIGKIPFVIWLDHQIVRTLRKDTVRVGKHLMWLDSADSLRLSLNGEFEPFETGLIKKEIAAGSVIIDIGANIGYHTLLFAEYAGDSGKVFSFEPEPQNFSLLTRNVALNAYHNVKLINAAVSDKNETITLFLSKDNKGDHQIYNSGERRELQRVQAVVLDDYFKNELDRINLIKMDIQGAEGKALAGMRMLMKRNPSVKLFTEFWPAGMKKCGVTAEAFLRMLQEYHFVFFDIDEVHKRLIKTDVAQLLARYTVARNNCANLFCTHE